MSPRSSSKKLRRMQRRNSTRVAQEVVLRNHGVHCLPMLLACAGDGSFYCPYHLDSSDLLVREFAARLELAATNHGASSPSVSAV
jgi:hypothetical protein